MSRLKLENKTRWNLYILICILLLASFIRFYRSTEYLPFWQEQVDDLLSVRAIWTDITSGRLDHLSLKGQMGTYRWSWIDRQHSPIYHGVAYYYILLPSAVLSHFDPYVVVLFLIFLGLAALCLLYLAGVLLFEDSAIGMLTAFLGSVSFWLASYSRWIWTPSTLPFFSVLSLVSFLKVVKGNVRWWYVLALSLALGSQVHSSGYVPLVFFLGMALWYKPPLPKRFFQRLLLVIVFVVPILPSVIYEVTSGFHMVKAMALLVSLPTGTTVAHTSGLVIKSIVAYVLDALGFTVMRSGHTLSSIATILSVVEKYPFFVLLGIVGIVAGLRRVFPAKSKRGKIFYSGLILSWWALFLPLPWFVESLYADETINEYSRMNNLVFAFPMLLLLLAYGCVWLWRTKSWLARAAVIGFLALYTASNWVTISDFLFRYSENSWAYKELQDIAVAIPKFADGKPYDLIIYRYSEGTFENLLVYEPLYFMDLWGKQKPETFNGVGEWGITKEPLRKGEAQSTIIIMDRKYLAQKSLPDGSTLVEKTPGYFIYRVARRI